ncbi:MAG: AraC family transcriptional regulator [Clostridia bacterium]|nr:AraC family transcriptional regulator [Clostridia bacterium]
MFYQFQHFSLSDYFCKEYGSDFSFPYHLHQCFELITVLSGEMNVMIDGEKYTIHPEEAVLVFPNQLHSLKSTKCEHMLCIFSPNLVKAFYMNVSKKIPVNNLFNLSRPVGDILKKLDNNSSLINKKGVLYLVCGEFDKPENYRDLMGDNYNLIYKIFQFVENNYNGDCSLNNLSKQTGFSYHYLSRYFKNTVKISFNSYVNQYRINNACYILKNNECSVLQCSSDCGYSSLRSFNRNFKAITGLTPMEFKNGAENH